MVVELNLNKYRGKRNKFTYDGNQIVKIGRKELKPLVYLRKFDFTDLSYYKSNKYGINRAIYQYIGYSYAYNLAHRTAKWTSTNISKDNKIGKFLRALMQMHKFKTTKELNKYILEHTTVLKRFDNMKEARTTEKTMISINQWEDVNHKWIICLNSKDAEVKISKEGKYIIK